MFIVFKSWARNDRQPTVPYTTYFHLELGLKRTLVKIQKWSSHQEFDDVNKLLDFVNKFCETNCQESYRN